MPARTLDEIVVVRVPGAVFYECFDPNCTEFPREHPEVGVPQWRKVGYGNQARYTVPAKTAALMLDHAQDFGEAMSCGVDDPRAGRMVARWVERERERLAFAHGVTLAYDPRWWAS